MGRGERGNKVGGGGWTRGYSDIEASFCIVIFYVIESFV